MTIEKDMGGPVFPSTNDVKCGEWQTSGHQGMTLWDYCMIHAPAAEIDGLIPPTIGELERYLDIPAGKYDYKTDYARALAKARGTWADAMIEARGK